jgi:hypothetical protein
MIATDQKAVFQFPFSEKGSLVWAAPLENLESRRRLQHDKLHAASYNAGEPFDL